MSPVKAWMAPSLQWALGMPFPRLTGHVRVRDLVWWLSWASPPLLPLVPGLFLAMSRIWASLL